VFQIGVFLHNNKNIFSNNSFSNSKNFHNKNIRTILSNSNTQISSSSTKDQKVTIKEKDLIQINTKMIQEIQMIFLNHLKIDKTSL
jgi:hypothetical protein